jgi:Cu-processing system ATP-binding protein
MIDIVNVEKSFGPLKVLRGVDFQALPGQCVALIGPNGCGKTTLLKCLLGMVVPDSGTITVAGMNIAGDWMYRRHLGYMPQIGRYPDQMKIGQVIEMLSDIRDCTQTKDEDLLNAFALRKLYHKRMGTLSGGTLQKVSAVIAFMNDPSVLILDEPTAGLDPVSSEILCEKIRTEQKRDKLIIITSHILSELDDLVSHIAYMQDGNLLLFKTLEELKDNTGTQKLSRAIASVMTSTLPC